MGLEMWTKQKIYRRQSPLQWFAAFVVSLIPIMLGGWVCGYFLQVDYNISVWIMLLGHWVFRLSDVLFKGLKNV